MLGWLDQGEYRIIYLLCYLFANLLLCFIIMLTSILGVTYQRKFSQRKCSDVVRSSNNKHMPSEGTSYIQHPYRGTKYHAIFHFNTCRQEGLCPSKLLTNHSLQFQSLQTLELLRNFQTFFLYPFENGPCWVVSYKLKPQGKFQRWGEWKEQSGGWAHDGATGRQVSAPHYIIWESDSLLVYFNEHVNYLKSSSSCKEIAKKPYVL